MRRLVLPISMGLWAVLAAACGSSTPASTGGGGATGTTTSSTSTTSSGGCSADATDACGTCMASTCCDAYAACRGDASCVACVEGKDSDACESTEETHARVTAYLECRGGACQTACIGASGDCKGALDGLVAAACQTCLEASCCAEVGACHAKEACWNDCFVNHSETACHADPDGHALYHAFGACYSEKCAAECGVTTVDVVCDDVPETAPSQGSCVTVSGAVACNPVTNEGCTKEGAACDHAESGFTCYDPPNTRTLCQTCSDTDGFCAAGFTCVSGVCAHYCCDDTDCGSAGHCDTTVIAGIGVCVKKYLIHRFCAIASRAVRRRDR
ncbi:Flagellar hook-length control protein FliK [Minicystis rosea]|nr:Flagellar hook-length control protein FliK [Minicystis rosea]